MPYLFDVSRCNLPPIPLVEFDFVDDCEVRPAPPAQHDCPDLEIPFTPFEIRPCQGFTFRTKLKHFKQPCNSESLSSFDSDGEFTMTAETTDVDGVCNTVITSTLRIPIICPEFLESGTVTIYQGLDDESATILSPSGELNIDQVDNDASDCDDPDAKKRCRFMPELVLKLPCPVINADSGVSVVKNGCVYNFGFGGLISSACVVIEQSGKVAEETTAVALPQLDFTFLRDPEQPCNYIVDFNLKLPRTRLYRGTVASDATGCAPTVQVNISNPEGGSLGVFSAKVHQRGCCVGKPLFAGNRVWLTYDFSEGWMIVSAEEILVAPIKLISDMYQGSATAQFNYYDTPSGSFTVQDSLNMFSNAPEQALGYAICNTPDGSGTWRVLALQQLAQWIIFTLTNDLAPTDTAPNAEVTEYHDGIEPPDPVQLRNNMKFAAKQGAKGIAIRRKRETGIAYEIQSLICKVT